MTNRQALVDSNGNVVNVVIWDGVSEWTPPDGVTVIASDVAGPGWTYADGQFTAPAEPVLPPSPIVAGIVFLARVTDNEYAMIMAAAAQNVQLSRWIDQLRLLGSIDVTSDTALAAKAALVSGGLLTADRAETIFST